MQFIVLFTNYTHSPLQLIYKLYIRVSPENLQMFPLMKPSLSVQLNEDQSISRVELINQISNLSFLLRYADLSRLITETRDLHKVCNSLSCSFC